MRATKSEPASGGRRTSANGARAAWVAAALAMVMWLAVGPATAYADSGSDDARERDEIAAILRAQGLTGAVWAVVEPQRGVRLGAAGLKHARRGTPLGTDDRVHIGSVTKTLLAAGVLRLVSEGRLALDKPIAEVLPHIAFDNPWADTDPVRVRHLLDHTAGLDDARLWQVFSTRPGPDTPLAEAFAGGASPLRVRSRPGSRVSYSNMGYTLLGMAVEATTGERYEPYLDAHLLAPLEMHDSTFRFVSQEGPAGDARLAWGHFDGGGEHAAVPMYLRPAGQFTTTAADMAKLARFLSGDGRVAGRPFVDEALLRAMGRPAGTEAAAAGLRAGYALGLATRDRHGVVGRCHGGNTVGYRAMLCLFAEQQRAFFVSVNADSETADYGSIDRALIRFAGVAPPPPAPPPPAGEADASAWAGYYVPAPNRFATFAWLDTTLGFLRVRADGASLTLLPFLSNAEPLVSAGGGLFRASGRVAASHVALEAAGGAVISNGQQTWQRVPAARLLPLWLSLVAGALGLGYVLIAGVARLATRRLTPSHPMFLPTLAALALASTAPLFYAQSFLQIGEATPASVALALATASLPLAASLGLLQQLRRRPAGAVARLDGLALLCLLQWALVLAAWGLLPLRLWA